MIIITVAYAIAIAILTIYGANLFWMAAVHAWHDGRRPGRAPDPDALPALPRPIPTVTVQLPVYNEPLVIERLIDACARLDFPRDRLEIQVLDDSTDATVQSAAERVAYWQARGLDIIHIRRGDREGFKAGALQNGLQIARGDFIAIFDADFVPRPDFLRRALVEFTDERIGLVQARWGHINADDSWLTRIQAIGLDAHFAIEQRVRALAGRFINFNGTAGIWRRSCIEEAGGWQGDTIAEDLDLSYRAQIAGWKLRYLDDLEVPAELPPTMTALRTQQFRWAKGSVETARKLLGSLWRSPHPARIKLQGTIHLTAHFVFPCILLAAILHTPLLVLQNEGAGPGGLFFGWMSLGLIGFAGFTLAQMLAQRYLYFDWIERLRSLPTFMAGSIGLSLHNSIAVGGALAGRRTPFIRTPKFGARTVRDSEPSVGQADADAMAAESDRRKGTPLLAGECALAAYSVVGLVALIVLEEWAAVPFQALFSAGFSIVALTGIHAIRDRTGKPSRRGRFASTNFA